MKCDKHYQEIAVSYDSGAKGQLLIPYTFPQIFLYFLFITEIRDFFYVFQDSFTPLILIFFQHNLVLHYFWQHDKKTLFFVKKLSPVHIKKLIEIITYNIQIFHIHVKIVFLLKLYSQKPFQVLCK